MDKRIKFYSQNTNLLPPKPKSSFRHLKQGIQEFHRKYVLVPADKAANNAVVVCRLHYVNTLKQELDGTRAYLETDTDEVSVVNAHLNDLPVKGIDSETHIWPCTYSFRCYSTCYKSNSTDLPHNKYTIIV